MNVVLFMCLWLDHYLHQHGGCGPTGATWLGGIATYTIARDRCTETIFVLVRPFLDIFTWYFEFRSMLPCDLCLLDTIDNCVLSLMLHKFHISF